MSSLSTDGYDEMEIKVHPRGGQMSMPSMTDPMHDHEMREPSMAAQIAAVNKETANNNPDTTEFDKYTSESGYDCVSGNLYTEVNEYPKHILNNNQAFAQQKLYPNDSNEQNLHPNESNDNAHVMNFQYASARNKIAVTEEEPVGQGRFEEETEGQAIIQEETDVKQAIVGEETEGHAIVEEETVQQGNSAQEAPSIRTTDQEKTVQSNEQLPINQPLKTNEHQTKDNNAGDTLITAKKNTNPLNFVTVSFYEFKCKFCNATFERRKAFKKHITNEHGILPYVCYICGSGYDHKSDLKIHVKEHTADKATKETTLAEKASKETMRVEKSSKETMRAEKASEEIMCEPGNDIEKQVPSDELEDVPKNQEQQKETGNSSYDVTQPQVNPEDKLHFSKSLHLLAQVSHMRDTRERSPRRVASTVVNSERKARVEENKPVVNKRKRGRPRRLARSAATANKRKQRQPRKAKPRSKKQVSYIDDYELFDEEEVEEKVVPKIKVEVTKGNYKLRPQTVEMDYSTQRDINTSPGTMSHTPCLYECQYCHVKFKTEAKKLRHETHHKEFSCGTCGAKFAAFKDMKEHEDKHFPDEMKCHFCNEPFKSKEELWAHEETHDESITCRWCGATYDKRSELDSHERLHFISKTSNTIFECHFCQKICRSRKSWKSHLVSHSNIRAFECEVCGKKYKQQGSFNLHMQRHNNTFYKFTCQFCGKKYGQKALLIIHERTHTNERPFKCPHCDLAYPSKNQLDHHMARVMGVKHMCSFCGKQLNSRSSLEIHERIHTGTRPIKCEFCDMDFIEASSYKYHLRLIHTGERFECKFCGKQCKSRGVLNAHMRVHTGERPFKCPHCDKAFRSGNVLRTHVQGIHMGVRHKCEKCGREFAQTSALNTHKKLVHDGLKWKDIQLQRKINRQNREKRDRLLIENATGKEQSEEVIGEPAQEEPVKYMEPVNQTHDPAHGPNEMTPSIHSLSDIERSLTSSVMASAPLIMATAPSMLVPHQAPSMLVPHQAPPSMVTPSSMMPPVARPIPESDRGSVDVIFPPVMSGTAMYHVL